MTLGMSLFVASQYFGNYGTGPGVYGSQFSRLPHLPLTTANALEYAQQIRVLLTLSGGGGVPHNANVLPLPRVMLGVLHCIVFLSIYFLTLSHKPALLEPQGA